MWSMAMTEPLVKQGSFSNNGHNNNNNNNGKKRDNWKENCCWRFNKGQCSYGKSCRFDHRCTYCGVFGHPMVNCNKKQQRRDRNGDRDKEGDRERERSQNKNKKHEN